MSDRKDVEELNARELTLTLQYLASDLLPNDAAVDGLADPSEGAELLQAFLTAAHNEQISVDPPLSSDSEVLSREALRVALDEAVTHDLAEDLLTDRPGDDQMSGLDQIDQHIAALGFLVAFLQTKVAVRVSRAGGKTTFDVSFSKQATSNAVVAKVLSLVTGLLPTASTQNTTDDG
jgi:hypothetical protein